MAKKGKKSTPVQMKSKEKAMVIDINEINLKNADHSVNFRTGGYMTKKDRPRDKNWRAWSY